MKTVGATLSQNRRVFPFLCLVVLVTAPTALGLGTYATVSVKEFGAKGDGTTDDSAALEAVGRYLSTTYQMAGSSFHGAVAPDVVFPAGTYRITRTICWPGGYARSTPPPGGSGGYRMTGYHFMRGQGGATIRQDNASADIFFLSGAYRTFIDNLTFQGGKRALKMTTYNMDSSTITIQNCKFQNSGDFALECIVRRSSTASTPPPGTADNYSMTEILHHYSRYDMYDNGTIRGYLDNSTTVPYYYNSTQMHVNNTQFTNCMGIAYSTCDGFSITNCSMDTASAMTGPAIRNGGIMLIDNVTAMVRITPGNGQYWIEHFAYTYSGSVIVRNTTLTTNSSTGVCPVYNKQKFHGGSATTQKTVVLEDSTFQVSGCPENCLVYCTEVPNIISIRHCTNSGATAVGALGFQTVPTTSYFTTAYFWFTTALGLGYTVDTSNTNITANLPASMVPYQRAALPDAQDTWIRTALQPNKEVFLSEAAMTQPGTVAVNVTSYGAKGDGSTNDTAAIRNAIAAAGSGNPVQLDFPAGRYCFSDTIDLPSRVTLRGQGCAAFIPLDTSKVCFRVNNAQSVAVYNCEFQQCAGGLNIFISQPGAQAFIKRCYFHSFATGTAVQCVGGVLASDQTAMGKLRISDCTFLGNKACLVTNVSCIFDSNWISNRADNTAVNWATLENYGTMRLEAVLGVPSGSDVRWIRNHGQFVGDSTRFGGESGGCCSVENSRIAGIGTNIVAFQNSWLINKDSAGPRCQVYCPNVPDQLILRTNVGIENPEAVSGDTNLATVYAEELPGNHVYFSGNTLPENIKTTTPPGTVFYDNFENDAAGTNPASTNVQAGTGQTATWSIVKPSGSPSDIQVVNDNGNKVLRLNYAAGQWEKATLQVDVGVGLANLQAGQTLVASFNIRYNRWTPPDKMGYKFLGKTAGQSLQTAGLMYNDSVNSCPMVSGAETIMAGKPIVVGHWYQVRQTYDLTNNTFIGTITDLNTGDTGSNTAPQPLAAGTAKIVGISFDPDSNAKSANLDIDEMKLEIVNTYPTFTPDSGLYLDPQDVVVTSSLPGATIRYTTDGSDPSDTHGTVIASSASILVDHSLTLKAKAWAAGYNPSDIKTAAYIFPRPASIPYGTATVDGDLSEWDNTTVWAPLDQDYYLTATDVPQAFYAARWTANKLYVAVKVQDTAHWLMDSYDPSNPDSWDAADQVEIYLHTTGSYSDNHTDYSTDQVAAQQYVIGVKSGNPNAVWSVLASGFTVPAQAGLQAAGRVSGQWLQYEVAMTPYQIFNLSGTGLVASPLSAGQVIGLDVVADSRYGPGDSSTNFGVKSENLLQWKYCDYTKIASHRLANLVVSGTASLSDFNMNPAGIAVSIQLRGAGATTRSVTLDSSGCFSVDNVTPGTYNVWIKPAHWLARRIDNVSVTGSVDLGVISFINGDVDNDNSIVGLDLSAILTGMDIFDETEDLDGDGEITSNDLSIVLAGMDRSGDQ